MATSVGFTFYGVVEDAYFNDETNYTLIAPEAFGFTGGQEVTGTLVLTGAVLDAYRDIDSRGTGQITVADGVDFFFPLSSNGDRQEDDLDASLDPAYIPKVTITRAVSTHPLADVSARLYETDEGDPINGLLGAAVGGALFSDDNDQVARIYGVWVPDTITVDRVVLGVEANDYFRIFDRDALVWGRGGDDIITLSAPRAFVWGGLGDDRIRSGSGEDTLYGGFGDDRIRAGEGHDTLYGEDDNDYLYGYGGKDKLYGGGGAANLLDGGAGADLLDGTGGLSDTADYRNAPAEEIESGEGVNVSLASGRGKGSDAEGDRLVGIENLYGSAFDDRLTGDAGVNRLTGAGGDDRLYGLAGGDKLYGGEGRDILNGGDGIEQDRLEGGAGADDFVFQAARQVGGDVVAVTFGNDRIVDFTPGEDRVSLFGEDLAFGDLTFEAYTSSAGLSGTRVRLTGGSIFFEGIAPGTLTASDFRFVDV